MKVWLVKVGEPTPLSPGVRRLRTGMLAETLDARGHEVTWWTGAFDHQQKKHVLSGGARHRIGPRSHLLALPSPGYARVASVRRYVDHLFLARRFRDRARMEPRPDVMVVAMPDHHLAGEAVRYARERDIPVIVDVRDAWPASFVDLVPRPLRGLARVALSRDFRILKKLLTDADQLIASTTTLLDYARAVRGEARTTDLVLPLGAPPLDDAIPPTAPSFVEEAQGRFVVGYVGTFGRVWDPSVIVRAARLLSDRVKDPPLFLLGGDGERMPQVHALAADAPNVRLTGWLQGADISALVRASHVGVVPAVGQVDAFPNKAYAFLSGGVPLISMVGGDLADELARSGAGIVVPPGDAEALAAAIQKVQEDEAVLRSMRSAATRLFEERLDARAIYARYADIVEARGRST